eukprot:jgi/Mesvir1/17807/Mv12909-RA.1
MSSSSASCTPEWFPTRSCQVCRFSWLSTAQKPFDSSTSRAERGIKPYDATEDPYFTPEQRELLRIRRSLRTDERSTTALIDASNARAREQVVQVMEARTNMLARIQEKQPALYAQSWQVPTPELAYYPTTFSAGGATISPLRQRMSVCPPEAEVPAKLLPSCASPTHKDRMFDGRRTMSLSRSQSPF